MTRKRMAQMTGGKKLLMAACSSFAFSASPASGAVIEIVKEKSEERESPFVVALRDRSLDEYVDLTSAAALDLRPAADFVDNYADDVGDGLFFAPGVTVNRLDHQEPRINIRGFAVGNGHHRSTVKVLRDGAPLTDVHGTTNTSEIDLQSTALIGVERGVVNLRHGGDNLGGVVNFVSKTGQSEASGVSGRLDAGASVDGKPGGLAHLAVAGGSETSALDYYAAITGGYENGYRANNERLTEQFHGNLGYRFSKRFSTRFYLDVANSETELAGGLDLDTALDTPNEPTPPITLGPLFPGGPIIYLLDGAREDKYARDIFEGRIANQTNFRLLGHDFELGGHYLRRDVVSPQNDFIGFVDESGGEWGARLDLERDIYFLGREATYRVGAAYSKGSLTSDRFENDEGDKGDPTSSAEYRSRNLTAFVQGVWRPIKRLAVDLGAKFVKTDRSLTDLDDNSVDNREFVGVSARGGLAYRLTDRVEIYASGSRGYENPAFEELIAGDPTDFNGLDEQSSFTMEGGLRGSLGEWIGFDIAYYNTGVEDEIINLADPSSIVNDDIFVNADKTTHKGIEAGVDLRLFPNAMARRGASLTWRNVYNNNNFRFKDAGPVGVSDGNRIGGVPVHLLKSELRYAVKDRWFIAANVEYPFGDYFADHENETMVPAEPVLGFSAGMMLNDRVELFASGENITNSDYIAGVAPVLSQESGDGRIFTPGARAAVYGGVKVKF